MHRSQNPLIADFLASWVVFLVALPLCMGIAIASGLPPAAGILTGVIGGIVVGTISGSPVQVSGPAAGLAVMVFQFVHDYGAETLGPLLMLAGLLQIAAGYSKFGRWFRAMSPGVIYGMLTGIGILLFAGQFYVMLDRKPYGRGLENLLNLPGALRLDANSPSMYAGLVGLITLAVLIAWNELRPEALRVLPGALIAVIVGATVTSVWHLPIQHVDLPSNLFQILRFPTLSAIGTVLQVKFVLSAFAIAFVASAETLLSAAAVDRLQNGERTNYDRELQAQGFGNFLCGFIGALPMTGVIVRSSANVQAGGKTRRSAILHGVWLLGFVIALPGVLRLVPTASLAAILVYTGIKLIEWRNIRELARYGTMPLVIYAATVIGIVGEDLLTGVAIGVILSLLKLLYKLSQMSVRFEVDDRRHRYDLWLEGAATFLNIPEIAAILDKIPPRTEVHVHTAKLVYIDHSCLDMFYNWAKQHEPEGSSMVVEWENLLAKYELQPL